MFENSLIKYILAIIGLLTAAAGIAFVVYKRLKPKEDCGYIEYDCDEDFPKDKADVTEAVSENEADKDTGDTEFVDVDPDTL